MPAKTTIFDARGNTVYSFPVASRNSIIFSPHARFILLAGFGNLQGTVDIYDRQRQFAKVATIEASNTSVCEWSPDGRYILTATTSPRLRVDNGVKIWHYSGKLIYVQEHDELFGVGWRPQDVASFPLRSTYSPAPSSHESAAALLSKSKSNGNGALKPTGAYRPPHARVSGVSVAPTSLFEIEQVKIGASALPPGLVTRTVPGAGGKPTNGTPTSAAAPALSKAAAKNKKKRENNKIPTNGNEERPARPQETKSSAAPINEPINAPTGSSPEDKKTRSLLKKLRAIEELKQRQALGDKLEETQVQKIQTEDSVRKELVALGWTE
jgi:translation initiation factor 2A